MSRIRRLVREIHRRSLWQVLGIYLVASWAVLQVVDTLGGALNLPDWFPSFAFALLLVGLPIVLATAFIQEGGPSHEAPPVEDAPPQAPVAGSGVFTWRNALGGGVLAFALWGVVAAAWVVFGGGTSAATSEAAASLEPVTERLFVMPLDNLTDDPDLDVLGRLAADEIGRAIDRRQPVAVVPSTTVSTTIRSLGGTPSVEAVAEGVHATHAFAGTVARIGDELRFDVELIDPRTSERLRSVERVSGPVSSVDSLVSALAALAATEAVVVFNPAAPPWVGDMSSPVSAVAYQAFLEQGRIFCTGDNAGSIAPGERAVRESPRFVAALYQLMQAHSNMGEDAVVDSLVDILDGLRGEMTRNEQLSLDWMTATNRGDLVAAERASEEAYRLDPVGRAGAAMMTKWRLGKMNEAIERLANLELPGACPWPGYYVQGTYPYHALGRHEEELALIREGLKVYPERFPFLEAEARALIGLGRLDAVDSLLAVMADLPRGPDRRFRAWNTALDLRAHGHDDRATRVLESMLETVRTSTSVDDVIRKGWLLLDLHRWDEAIPVLESVENQNGAMGYVGDTGYFGDRGAALAEAGRRDEALAMSARIDGIDAQARQKYWQQGRIAAALGDRDEAVRLLGLGFQNGRIHTPDIPWDWALEGMRGYGPFDALVRPR